MNSTLTIEMIRDARKILNREHVSIYVGSRQWQILKEIDQYGKLRNWRRRKRDARKLLIEIKMHRDINI